MRVTKRISLFIVIVLLFTFMPISAFGQDQQVQLDQLDQLGLQGQHPLEVVRGGQARAVILIAADADEGTKAAADTLAEYVGKSTGASLAVMTEAELHTGGGPMNGYLRIYVGTTASGGDSHVTASLAGLGSDGFVIHPHGNSLTIIGPSSGGTKNGVYDFLERYIGVRWLMPGPDGEDVPQRTDLAVPRTDIREEPAFLSRTFSPLSLSYAKPEERTWSERNRLQTRINFHHNLYNLFPSETYGSSHPEFYPLRNGQRYIPAKGVSTGWQPCFTEPGTVQAAVYTIVDYFRNNPNETSYSLGVNDGGGFCEAEPNHPANPHRNNSLGIPDMSDIYYGWVNQVVEQVLAVYPDKWFGVLAYQEVNDPPSFPLNPRVVPFLTKDRMAWADSAVSQKGKQTHEQWNTKAASIGWYDYIYGTPYLVPRNYPHLMADNYRYAKEHGTVAQYAELYTNWGEGPKPWVSAHLQWNPYQDVDALLSEWYVRAVGPAAASDLAAYYAIWEKFWTVDVLGTPWFQSRKGTTFLWFNSPLYLNAVTDNMIAQSRQLLESVLAKAVTDPQKARARMLLRAFEYYEASALSYPKQTEPPKSETEALQMLDRVEATMEENIRLANKRLELVKEFKTDLLLYHPIDPTVYKLVWSGWNENPFWQLADYMKTQEPAGGPVRQRVAALANLPEPSALRDYARLLSSLETAPSLVANSSFEQGTDTASNWTPSIVKYGKFERKEGFAYSGNASIYVHNFYYGGLSQTVPAQPGPMAARLRYYVTPETQSVGTIFLSFHLLGADGSVLSSLQSPQAPFSGSLGKWSEIRLLNNIPAAVNGNAVRNVKIEVTVNGFQEGGELYLDDFEAKQVVSGVPQLNDNASFESGTTDAPPWKSWVASTGTIKRVQGVSRTGTASLLLSNMARGGPVQNVAVDQAGTVTSRVYYYTPPGTATTGTIQLSFNMLDANNKNIATLKSVAKPIAATSGTWADIEFTGQIPNNAVTVQMVAIVDGFTTGGIYLDDYTLAYKTP